MNGPLSLIVYPLFCIVSYPQSIIPNLIFQILYPLSLGAIRYIKSPWGLRNFKFSKVSKRFLVTRITLIQQENIYCEKIYSPLVENFYCRKRFLVTWRGKSYKAPVSPIITLSRAKYWPRRWGSHEAKYFMPPWRDENFAPLKLTLVTWNTQWQGWYA